MDIHSLNWFYPCDSASVIFPVSAGVTGGDANLMVLWMDTAYEADMPLSDGGVDYAVVD
jgi:hypothetical protein